MSVSASRVEELFFDAIELAPSERAHFLDRACAEDAELRDELDSLISAHESVGHGFLEPASTRGLVGQTLGSFTLVRMIGHGGMGTVYEAEQERPHRQVALKVLRVLPGDDHDVSRFALEAEVMAQLHHPGVAQVFEVGTHDEAGSHLIWFAMELVEDACDIVTFVEQKHLSRHARIELFLSLCRAVEHGHQRGVLHRDLKPDNVLVDGEGRLKVIDFGVARAAGLADQELGRQAAESEGDVVGTLSYMSPEQCLPASDRAAEPDTRSDIYALGVILYQLLTGERPHSLAGQTATDAFKIIRHQNPIPPSRRTPDVQGDLETIILVALEKDPDDRYGTAQALGDDLRRFNHHEPLLARPSSPGHALALAIRRNRTSFATVALLIASLVTATIVSTSARSRAVMAAERENQAARVAREAANEERIARTHSERVASFLEQMLVRAQPRATGAAELRVREVLDDALLTAERELGPVPDVLARVLSTLGYTYVLLGEYQTGREVLERSIALAETGVTGPLDLAVSRSHLGLALLSLGEFDLARAQLESAIETLSSRTDADPLRLVEVLVRAAELARQSGDREQAREYLNLATSQSGRVRGLYDLVDVAAGLGNLDVADQNFSSAEQHFSVALEELERFDQPNLHSLGSLHNSLASVYFHQGRVQDADDHWSQALAILERLLGPDHLDVLAVSGNLALVSVRLGDFAKAEASFQRVLDSRRTTLGPLHPRVANTLVEMAGLFLTSGDLDRAEEAAREAVAIDREFAKTNPGSPILATHLVTLALVYKEQGDLESALLHIDESLQLNRAQFPAGHPSLAGPLTLMASLYIDNDDPASAEPLLFEAHTIRSTRLPDHWLAANTASLYGECLLKLGRISEAAPLITEAAAALRDVLPAGDFRLEAAEQRVELLGRSTASSTED